MTTTSTTSVGVGTRVLYQPTAEEWPMGHHQHPAIVTAWDADNLQANLMLFFDNFQSIRTKTGVSEGVGDGTFQQLGTASKTQQTKSKPKAQ